MRRIKIENLDQPVIVPKGTIGVVSEIGATLVGLMNVHHLVFPSKPLPGAPDVPGVLRIVSRQLTVLRSGESLTIRSSGVLVSGGKKTITNDNGRAKIERAGILGVIFGSNTKYESSSD